MSDITSVDLEADQDLRDVFKLMYDDEEDWTIDEVCPNSRHGQVLMVG